MELTLFMDIEFMEKSDIEALVVLAKQYKLARLTVGAVDIITTPYTYQPVETAPVVMPQTLDDIFNDPDLYPEN